MGRGKGIRVWPFTSRRQPAVIDPADGDPRARELVDALGAHDWHTVREIFVEAPDPDARVHLMGFIAEVEDLQESIGEWVEAEPRSTLPLLVCGCHAVYWARQARDATDAGDAEFRWRLRIAEDVLAEVLARDPDDVTARTWLAMAADLSRSGSRAGLDDQH